MAVELKPAYLIHGDDHDAITSRRASLRRHAEGQGGNVEVPEGEDASPAGVAGALSAMTLAIGRRVIIVDGVERWREAEVKEAVVPALAQMPPETTLALVAREDARAKAPAAVHGAVKGAGGQVIEHASVKPWALPKWVAGEAGRYGLALDRAAAKTLVDIVGERPQRLLRELERFSLELEESDRPRALDAEQVADLASRSSELQVFALADALVGRDPRAALAIYMRLRGQGERGAGLVPRMAFRVRDALSIALGLAEGRSPADLRKGLRMPPRAADRLMADVARSDPQRLRDALCELAGLELDSRGGSPLPAGRSPLAGMGEDTLAVHAIAAITR